MPYLIQKMAKLKRTRAKLKTGTLLLDYMSGSDDVRPPSELRTLPKIQTVHAFYDISRLLYFL
jgi:hypothetical protein